MVAAVCANALLAVGDAGLLVVVTFALLFGEAGVVGVVGGGDELVVDELPTGVVVALAQMDW